MAKHGNSKYPWSLWTDRTTWKIRKDHQFTCSTKSMSKAHRNKAAELGLRVTVHVDGNVIQFRFIKGKIK